MVRRAASIARTYCSAMERSPRATSKGGPSGEGWPSKYRAACSILWTWTLLAPWGAEAAAGNGSRFIASQFQLPSSATRSLASFQRWTKL